MSIKTHQPTYFSAFSIQEFSWARLKPKARPFSRERKFRRKSRESHAGALSAQESCLEEKSPSRSIPLSRKTYRPEKSGLYVLFERATGIEPASSAWKADIIATIRRPHIFLNALSSYYLVPTILRPITSLRLITTHLFLISWLLPVP